MDTNAIYIIIFVIVLGFAVLVAFLNKKLSEKAEPADDKAMLMLQQQLNQLSEQLNRGLAESHETIQKQFSSSAGIIKDVTEKLTKLEDTNKQVVGIADQLEGLERVLKNPKQRGILGEYYLETLLKNLFQPNQYQMQYPFKDGTIADAVIFLKGIGEPQSIIPIDSKFSLENYNKIIEEKDAGRKEELQKAFKQDLKNRIDETSKYIKPRENTMDFAFMFIPSEGIYYDLLVNQVGTLKVNTRDLIEYAFKEKRVIIVSPTSFAAYLQTVLQGLRALSIEKSVKEIVNNVHKLGSHLGAYETYFTKLGSNLGTTVGAYNDAYKELGKIDKDVTKITGEPIDVEVLQIDKPHKD
jgi:DNA recombination protein RmuC